MELDKKEAEIVNRAIQSWEEDARISKELATELRGSYSVRNANVDAIAIYALISAVSCGLLAFGALVLDEKWIELLRKRWGFSENIVGILFTSVAGLFVYLAKRRINKNSRAKISNEVYNIAIILTVAIAITYWTRGLLDGPGNYALPLLFAAIAYGCISVFLRSTLLWVAAIVALSGWWGAQTHYWAGGSYQFMGMNYPLRMTVFGLAIWVSSFVIGKIQPTAFLKEVTYTVGLLLFLIAGWTLSIFGNYADYEGWKALKQSHFWFWALGFTLVLAGMLYYAFQFKQETLRDLCLVFFLLNIYTRYFEYFWDRTNAGIFFALLALSFWFVAKKAEQWRSKAAG